MKLEFVYSHVYFRNLNKFVPCKRTWKEVVRLGKAFEKMYASHMNKIVNIIPTVVGKAPQKDIIHVYIVDWQGPSFSHPLTLKVRDDLLLMLVILTHELLHDFFIGEEKKSIESVEEQINIHVEEVFKKLNMDVTSQLEILHSFHTKRFNN